jgi:hypothetical protein
MVGEDDMAQKLPTLVPGIRPAYSTPLPTLPMVVLCIVSRPFNRAEARRCCPSCWRPIYALRFC